MLPDEQQVKLAVCQDETSAITVDECCKIRASRRPILDLAKSESGPIGRDLNMPTGTPRRTPANAGAGHGVASGRRFRDGNSCGSILRVVRIERSRFVGRANRRRWIVRPEIALDGRTSSWIGRSRRYPSGTRKNE